MYFRVVLDELRFVDANFILKTFSICVEKLIFINGFPYFGKIFFLQKNIVQELLLYSMIDDLTSHWRVKLESKI